MTEPGHGTVDPAPDSWGAQTLASRVGTIKYGSLSSRGCLYKISLCLATLRWNLDMPPKIK